jgi:hypothetical protein
MLFPSHFGPKLTQLKSTVINTKYTNTYKHLTVSLQILGAKYDFYILGPKCDEIEV